MSQWTQWFSLSSWFSGNSAAAAQQLLAERTAPLAANTTHIERIAEVTERLKALYIQRREQSPVSFQSFPEASDTLEMANQLTMVTLAASTELTAASQALDVVRANRELLEQIIAIWDKVEQSFDKSIAAGASMQQMDMQNVEDLSKLVSAVQNLGIPANCRQL